MTNGGSKPNGDKKERAGGNYTLFKVAQDRRFQRMQLSVIVAGLFSFGLSLYFYQSSRFPVLFDDPVLDAIVVTWAIVFGFILFAARYGWEVVGKRAQEESLERFEEHRQ